MKDNCNPCKTETLNYFNHDGNYYIDCKSKNKIYRCIYDVKLKPIDNIKKSKELKLKLDKYKKNYMSQINLLKNNFEKRFKKPNDKNLLNQKNKINENLDGLLNDITVIKNNLKIVNKKKYEPIINKKLKKDLNLSYNVRKKESYKKKIKKKKTKK